jgi:hypothetical protein
MDTIETYEEWLARREYSVVRNHYKGHPSNDVVVAAGLSLEQAREMAERLNGQEWASSPGSTSWALKPVHDSAGHPLGFQSTQQLQQTGKA